MPDLTSSLDMTQLMELFQNPDTNREAIRQLGPQLTGGVVSTEGQGVGVMDLPAARDLGAPQLGSAEANLHGQAEAEPKSGTPWIDLLRLGSVGLTDLGNALGNPRAPVGGALYEQNKAYFRSQQEESLKRRHDMFDDAMKQSQSLPAEALTDPRFSALAAAKAALEKDAADGKIDNEKTVTKFLVEQARVKRDLEQLTQETSDRDALAREERLDEGRKQQANARRVELERIVNNPTSVPPDQLRAAQLELDGLKARDMMTREVGGASYTLPASEWAKHDLETADREKQYAQQKELERMREGAMERRMGIAQTGANERARMAADANRAYRGTSRVLSDVTFDIRQRIAAQKAASQSDPRIQVDPVAAEAAALNANGNAILAAAENAGIHIRQDHPGLMIIEGRPYFIQGPQDRLKALQAVLSMLQAGGSTSSSYEDTSSIEE